MKAFIKDKRIEAASFRGLKMAIANSRHQITTGDVVTVKPSDNSDIVLSYKVTVSEYAGVGYGNGKKSKKQRSKYSKKQVHLLCLN